MVNDTPKSLAYSPCLPPNAKNAPRTDARGAFGCLGLLDATAQVFGNLVHALECSAGLFVGAMPRASAALGAVGASAFTVNTHAHSDKRDADHSQNDNIDRCQSKPPLVNHHLLYTIPHPPKRDRFILVGFICGNATSPPSTKLRRNSSWIRHPGRQTGTIPPQLSWCKVT